MVTANLWKWLDTAKDNLWRKGKTYPSNYSMLRQLLADKEVDIAISFNPSDASAAIARGELPDTIRTYIHRKGTLANVHFLAIPFNSSDQESAKKVANFLLSPEAQLKKADSRVCGVLKQKLSKAERFAFLNLPRGIATLDASELSPTLTEPHPSWVPKLESAWMERYASGK